MVIARDLVIRKPESGNRLFAGEGSHPIKPKSGLIWGPACGPTRKNLFPPTADSFLKEVELARRMRRSSAACLR